MSEGSGPPATAPSGSGAVPLRDRRQAITRRAILDAGRELFAARGFTATSMKLLAERAGVAVQTIYSIYGSKGGVLAGMVDLLDEVSGIQEVVAELQRTDDPREIIRLWARTQRQIKERAGDISSMIQAGAATDEQVAAVWAEGMRRHHGGIAYVIKLIESAGGLRPDVSRDRACDMAAALSTNEVCAVLVHQRNWTFDEYEHWLTDTMTGLVLA